MKPVFLGLILLLAMAAAPDTGLSPSQQRDLLARVEKLERDVAALQAALKGPGVTSASRKGGLRVEDHGGQTLGNQPTETGSMTPEQQRELQKAMDLLKQQAEQRKDALRQLGEE